MGQVLQNQQALLHDGMRFLTFDMRHKTNATGVMFVRRVIQALRQGTFLRCNRRCAKRRQGDMRCCAVARGQNGARAILGRLIHGSTSGVRWGGRKHRPGGEPLLVRHQRLRRENSLRDDPERATSKLAGELSNIPANP